MNLDKYFKDIMEHAHFWNWLPDWGVVEEIYRAFPNSFSVLTPFAYAYLEELIRSMTTDYGRVYHDKSGNPTKKKVGYELVQLAIEENKAEKPELAELLENIKKYFSKSQPYDKGDNRNSVLHGYMHPRFWDEDSFENLIKDIASISKYSGF